jgi:XRE family transcriptional regulator, aerobic/anaerobic benzoate catabolism transcriptional regulator
MNIKNFSLTSVKNIEKEKLILDKLGFIIRKYRSQRGLSRQMLATKSNISLRYLAQLEGGSGNPSITILKNIAYALNITLENLLFANSYEDKKVAYIKKKIDHYEKHQITALLELIDNIDKKKTIKINKNKIALIGLRGAGKSTLGNMYSKEFKIPIYEITKEIEKIGGMNINEIIEFGGQSMYRRLEYTAIHNLYKKNKKLIILTGGSVVSEKETFNFLLKNFYTVWIKASPKEHMKRVIKQGDLRPISSNPKAMEDLNNILKERQHLYSKASEIVNTENKDKNFSYKDLVSKIKN